MRNLLFEYYLIRFGILALFLACGAGAAAYWVMRRRWLGRLQALEQKLAECQTTHFQMLHNHFHRIVAHEYGKGLEYILNKSARRSKDWKKNRLHCTTSRRESLPRPMS